MNQFNHRVEAKVPIETHYKGLGDESWERDSDMEILDQVKSKRKFERKYMTNDALNE